MGLVNAVVPVSWLVDKCPTRSSLQQLGKNYFNPILILVKSIRFGSKWTALQIDTYYCCFVMLMCKFLTTSNMTYSFLQLEKLEEETVKWCREILRNSPTAIRVQKAALNAVDDGHAGLQVSLTSDSCIAKQAQYLAWPSTNQLESDWFLQYLHAPFVFFFFPLFAVICFKFPPKGYRLKGKDIDVIWYATYIPLMQELGGNATLIFYGTEEGNEGKNAYLQHRPPDFSRFPRLP